MASVQTARSIRQLAVRLEDATSSERIQALEELQKLAHSYPGEVGEIALERLIEVLQERGSTAEYLEALNVFEALIKTTDTNVSQKNVHAILSESSHMELFLDLLDHEDATIGVMASQSITAMHDIVGDVVEDSIQKCPDGMNKLLQRLPDSSREAVRDQALILVQKLTRNSEEMKKTLVFNDGFEVLVGIIQSEYDASAEVEYADTGPVVQDCLRIFSHALRGSETVQRFFFGMGTNYPLRLAYFFDPALLEQRSEHLYDDDEIEAEAKEDTPWYARPGCVPCAVRSLNALSASLDPASAPHQELLGVTLQGLIPAAAYCLARNGPASMVQESLELLERLVRGNEKVAQSFSEAVVKATAPLPGNNIPLDLAEALPQLTYGYPGSTPDPSGTGADIEVTCISVPCLIAERFVHSPTLWSHDGLSVDVDLSNMTLSVLDAYFGASSAACSLAIQHILAPPPPPVDSDVSFDMEPASESTKPFIGTILCIELVEACCKIQVNVAQGDVGVSSEIIARCCRLLTLIFVHGEVISRELFSAITVGHLYNGVDLGERWQNRQISGVPPGGSTLLISFILSSVNRIARLSSSYKAVPDVLVALLSLLSVAISGCTQAADALLRDPSNLFVVDLASEASELAGVAPAVRISSCLFLSACCNTFPPADGNKTTADDALDRKSFLGVINGRLTLKRFSEIMRSPIDSPDSGDLRAFFFSEAFRIFFKAEVKQVMKSIYEFYNDTAGDTVSLGEEVGEEDKLNKTTEAEKAQRHVVALQNERIMELEQRLQEKTLVQTKEGGDEAAADGEGGTAKVLEHERTIAELQRLLSEREASHAQLFADYQENLKKNGGDEAATAEATKDLKAYILDLEHRSDTLSAENNRLLEVEKKYNELTTDETSDTTSRARIQELEDLVNSKDGEIADHKQELDGLRGALKAWEEAVQQRDDIIRDLHAEQQRHEEKTEATPSFMGASQQGPDGDSPFAHPAPGAPGANQEEAMALRKTIEDHQEEATALKKTIQDHQEEAAALKKTIEDHQEEAAALKKTIEDTGLKLHEKDAELEQAKEDIKSLEKDLARQVAAVSEATRALEDGQEVKMLREGLLGLKAQLKAVTRERDDLLNMQPLTEAASNKETANGESGDNVNTLRAQLDKRNNDFANLERQLEACEQQAQTMLHQEDMKHREAIENLKQMATERDETIKRLSEELEQQSQGRKHGTPIKAGGGAEPSFLMSPVPLPSHVLQTPLSGGMSGISDHSRVGFRDNVSMLGAGGSQMQQKEIARLTSEVGSERRKLQSLRDTHNDLLSLLAQEEVELGVYREMLERYAGEDKVVEALRLAQQSAIDKYGSYVNLHYGEEMSQSPVKMDLSTSLEVDEEGSGGECDDASNAIGIRLKSPPRG